MYLLLLALFIIYIYINIVHLVNSNVCACFPLKNLHKYLMVSYSLFYVDVVDDDDDDEK